MADKLALPLLVTPQVHHHPITLRLSLRQNPNHPSSPLYRRRTRRLGISNVSWPWVSNKLISISIQGTRGGRRRRMEEEDDWKKTKKKAAKWPKIKPKTDLQITHLKDTHLFTVSNFFTSAESIAFVKIAESMGFVHQGSLGPTKGEAYRDNDRISVNDPVLAQTIWESGLNKLFADMKIRGKSAVGLNPNIRFYRYKVGQRFGRHIDESVDLENGQRTYYTLLIYLSGGVSPKTNESNSQNGSSSEPLVGGETVFYNMRRGVVAEVAPMEGMALLHIHGDKCMLHEARNVTKGVKYVFRSDVVFA